MADQAFDRFMELHWENCIDVGAGAALPHTQRMRDAGRHVTAVGLDVPPYMKPGNGLNIPFEFERVSKRLKTGIYDALWSSHFLEHCLDVHETLRIFRRILAPGGVLCVTVPPLKGQIVGGHVNLFNPGLLLYRLVLAGFDCSKARVGVYGDNISVIIERVTHTVQVELRRDAGDVFALNRYFPLPIRGDSFDGNLTSINW